jgi:hypothetical protein
MNACMAVNPNRASSSIPSNDAPTRSALVRAMDALAEWQIRRSYCLIRRSQMDNATMTGVNQPSSTNERSSIRPCDR